MWTEGKDLQEAMIFKRVFRVRSLHSPRNDKVSDFASDVRPISPAGIPGWESATAGTA